MFRSTWVPLLTELQYYDQKLTTHHAHNKHTHHNQPEFKAPIIFTRDGRVMGAIFVGREHRTVQVPYMRGK